MASSVFDSRESRGQDIARIPNGIARVDEREYQVISQSGRQPYSVISTEFGWSCSCPDNQYRGKDCKHIFAVRFSQKLRQEVATTTLCEYEAATECVMCASKRIVRDGVRHNKAGDLQKWRCLDCHYHFSVNVGFDKMKHDPKAITTALQLYFSGESLRNTQRSLRLLGVQVSHKTVWKWIQKYVGLMQTHLDKITPQVSDTWRADEMFVKVKGDMKYLYAMMDDETRFWIAQEVAETKQRHNARGFFFKSMKAGGKVPATLITDGLQSYHIAFKKVYSWRRTDVKPKHIREITIRGKIHNNKMERMNGEVRDRERVMRGLKAMDTPILKGVQIYHNFIKPHEALDGKTPADAAGIIVKGDNKWKTLIQNAAKPS